MPRRAVGTAVALTVALSAAGAAAEPQASQARTLDIREFRIEGANTLPAIDVERAVDPFLGPWRDLQDVEKARQALEQAYSDKGYQSVAVAIPQQTVRDGIVRLVVTEGTVGRLRVHGARFFSPRDVKLQAPSVAEGAVPNFNALVRDLVALNMIPDRRVVPALRAGVLPGTVDVDLNVEDTLPLHGSLEVNDRQSSNTVANRLSGALRYDNLWQLGHSLGFSFQLAPERLRDGEVFAATYLARLPEATWVTLSVNGVLQRSDVYTAGGVSVAGRGRIAGGRATFTLPSEGALFHTVACGVDYKHFDEGITLGDAAALNTPLTYWPATLQYGATWAAGGSQTQLGLSTVFNLRGLGSDTAQFDQKQYGASASFIYYRAEVSRSDELFAGLQLLERIQGQYSAQSLSRTAGAGMFDEALVGSEKLVAGGMDSVRGYLEAQVAGDLGAVGGVEVRGPSATRWFGRPFLEDLRLVGFADGAWVRVNRALPEQDKVFRLLGVGGGVRLAFAKVVRSAVDVGVPLASQGPIRRLDPRIHFRVSTEF